MIPKQITEADLIGVTTRIESVERRVETLVSDSTKQFTQMAVQMGVFEANLKTATEENRRMSEKQERSIADLKISTENHFNAIFDKLGIISNALGLDGSPGSVDKVRETQKYFLKRMNRNEETYNTLWKEGIVWLAKWLALVFIAGLAVKFGFKVDI